MNKSWTVHRGKIKFVNLGVTVDVTGQVKAKCLIIRLEGIGA